MLKKLLRLEGKAAGRLITLSLSPEARWSSRDYAGFAREGYARNAVAHRCIRMISESVASIPFRVEGEGEAADTVRRLLARPNPDQSACELFETLHGQLQVAGNAYLELTGGETGPHGLFALRPDRMRVIQGPKGWADGWEYRLGHDKRVFERDRASGRSPILHLKLFNPTDDHYGLPPMEAAAKAVDVHNAGGAWAKALLDNAARPSGALVVTGGSDGEARLTDQQFERLKAELTDLHAGPGNAGRPLLLEGGLDWRPMSMSPMEMDFLNARREAAREIALAFAVPPMLLGIPGDNTYSNYREANLAFFRQTILPLARKSAEALSAWLAPWFGSDVSLCIDETDLPALSDERTSRWNRISQAGFLSDQEKRQLLGFEDASR